MLPKTNMAPENRASQKESSIPTIHFQGAMLVLGRVLLVNMREESVITQPPTNHDMNSETEHNPSKIWVSRKSI